MSKGAVSRRAGEDKTGKAALQKLPRNDFEITIHEMRIPSKSENFGTPLSTLSKILGESETTPNQP